MGRSALASFVHRLATSATVAARARSGASWTPPGEDHAPGIRSLAAALVSYGLQPNGSVAVIGPEGCDTLVAELAVLATGASLVSVHPQASGSGLAKALASRRVVQAIAADEDSLRRVLAVRPDLDALELVLLMNAPHSERKTAALRAEAAIEVGAEALRAQPTLLMEARAAEGNGPQSVTFVRSDGGFDVVELADLIALSHHIAGAVEPGPQRGLLVALPIAGIKRLAALLGGLDHGAEILIADPNASPDAGLTEVDAAGLVIAPASLGSLRATWVEDIERRSWIGRAAAGWSIRQGATSLKSGWKHRLADSMTLRGFRNRLGANVTTIHVVSSARDRADLETVGYFKAFGLSIRDVTHPLLAR
jgi:hypothetical protein